MKRRLLTVALSLALALPAFGADKPMPVRIDQAAALQGNQKPAAGAPSKKAKGEAMFEVMQQRKSVRHFTGAPVSKADLEKIVRAGMAAPTARNMQPWSFVVVTEREALDRLAKVLPYAQMLKEAGAAIVVCTEAERAAGHSKEFAIIDASLAGENILLAIEALGLGGLWTAVYPDTSLMVKTRAVLGIPVQVIPLNAIPIGVPTGEDKAQDKYHQEKVHWERW